MKKYPGRYLLDNLSTRDNRNSPITSPYYIPDNVANIKENVKKLLSLAKTNKQELQKGSLKPKVDFFSLNRFLYSINLYSYWEGVWRIFLKKISNMRYQLERISLIQDSKV